MRVEREGGKRLQFEAEQADYCGNTEGCIKDVVRVTKLTSRTTSRETPLGEKIFCIFYCNDYGSDLNFV